MEKPEAAWGVGWGAERPGAERESAIGQSDPSVDREGPGDSLPGFPVGAAGRAVSVEPVLRLALRKAPGAGARDSPR